MDEAIAISLFSLLTLVCVVVFHLGSVALSRIARTPIPSGTRSLSLILLIIVGGLGLWRLLDPGIGATFTRCSPPFLRFSAISLYLSGCLIYFEVQSLLSRGYSLRILVDLLDSGGSARLEDLKADYGGGMGIRGILGKRLRGLARLRLVRFEEERVGPLTSLGMAFAMVGSRIRQVLNLGSVG